MGSKGEKHPWQPEVMGGWHPRKKLAQQDAASGCLSLFVGESLGKLTFALSFIVMNLDRYIYIYEYMYIYIYTYCTYGCI